MEMEKNEEQRGEENPMVICPTFIPKVLQAKWALERGKVTMFNCYYMSIRIEPVIPMKLTEFLLLIERDLDVNIANIRFNSSFSSYSISVDVSLAAGKMELKVEQVEAAMDFQEKLINISKNASLDLPTEPAMWNPCQYLLLPINDEIESRKVDASMINWSSVYCFCSKETFRGGVENCNKVTRYAMSQPAPGSNMKVSEKSLITADGEASIEHFINTIVCVDHSKHYYCVTCVSPSLTGGSKFPNPKYDTYHDYYKRRHKKLICEDQPLLKALPLSHFACVDLFTNTMKKDHFISERSYEELPPKLCTVVAKNFSASIPYTFRFIPSIMNKLEGFFLAEELKKEISRGSPLSSNVPTVKILEAITRESCLKNISLESLETLGDSFLKYVVSKNLFLSLPLGNEGQLSKKRENVVRNHTLHKLAKEKNILGYIRTKAFSISNWMMPGCRLNNCANSNDKWEGELRKLKSKNIADVVEALIGAHLEGSGKPAALDFMKWVGVEMDILTLQQQPPSYMREVPPLLAAKVDFEALTDILSYSFQNRMLLIEAITHGSYQDGLGTSCYQRLEFLGDAVLDYLYTQHFYKSYPGLSPGLLTDLRSAAVNSDSYSQVAVKWDLHHHLRHASQSLETNIAAFVDFVRQNDYCKGGKSFGWIEAKAAEVLEDMVEAIAGAIYIDSGSSLEIVWNAMRPLLEPLVTPQTLPYQPFRELQELCKMKYLDMKYNPTREKENYVICLSVTINENQHKVTQSGPKKLAKKLAAQQMLKLLKDLGFIYSPRNANFDPNIDRSKLPEISVTQQMGATLRMDSTMRERTALNTGLPRLVSFGIILIFICIWFNLSD